MSIIENVDDKHDSVTIIVNTKPHSWAEKKITFEQVVEIAFPGQPYNPEGTTVEHSRGHGPDHSLRPGGSVEVKEGMIFDVELATRS
jgi:Multiubiquitin